MNRERRTVHFALAFDDFAVIVHQQKIGSANLAEMHAERIHPKMVEALGIARGNVAGHAFVETALRK